MLTQMVANRVYDFSHQVGGREMLGDVAVGGVRHRLGGSQVRRGLQPPGRDHRPRLVEQAHATAARQRLPGLHEGLQPLLSDGPAVVAGLVGVGV